MSARVSQQDLESYRLLEIARMRMQKEVQDQAEEQGGRNCKHPRRRSSARTRGHI